MMSVVCIGLLTTMFFASPNGTRATRKPALLTDDKLSGVNLPITPAAGCTGANFTQPAGSPITVGTGPNSIAVADFNLDGRPDLIVGNEVANNLSVLLGNGNGGFSPAPSSPVATGKDPIFTTVADFNLDGKPDIALTTFDDQAVNILLGDGAGGFTAAPSLQHANLIWGVTAGDFNLDGKPDLAVTNLVASGTVTIYLGNGSGGFAPSVLAISVGGFPKGITTGDFDLDGKPDLAVANQASSNLTILLGNGSGGFAPTPGSPLATGPNPNWVTSGDFNFDGRPDLAVLSQTGNSARIFLGNGAGGFTPTATDLVTGSQPNFARVADFNLDGKPDLVITNGGTTTVTIALGDGAGGFTPAAGSPVTVGQQPFSVAVGDFNLDGRPDFATANSGANTAAVELNTCNAQPCGGIGFTVAPGSPFSAQDRVATIGDFNRDGKLDLAVVSVGGSNSLSILLGNGTGGFTQAPGSPMNIGLSSLSIVSADFNSDGKPDLAIARSGASGIAVLFGNGSGGFSGPQTFGGSSTLFPQSIGMGDFNRDGQTDLIVALANGGAVLLLGDKNDVFGPAPGSPFATPPTVAVTVADFNRDGKLDAAFADYNSNKVTVLLGDGAGALSEAPGSPIAVGKDPESITSGDFNHDGKADIAVGNLGDGNVTVLLGDGTGGFTQPAGSPFAAVTNAFSIRSGDFNLDGNPDLVLVSTTAKSVTVLVGTGAGGFSQPAGSPIIGVHGTETVTVGDFNTDGRADLAVVNDDVGGVTIYLNGCTGAAPTPTPTPTPTPNVVQFNSANVNVTEACTSVAVTVNRLGDTSTAATVDYATADGTATERGDYITTRGTLSFAPGDTSKTITVLINDDSFVEGTETFNINLSNPVGFNLGTPVTAVVSIFDNPNEPATNVIDDAQTFVCQHYHDFLNRQPDQAGWDFWTNQITACGADAACRDGKRVNVSAAFFLSIEFQNTGFFVERMYKAAYGDATGTSTIGGNHQLPVPVMQYNEFVTDTQRIARGVVVLQSGWQQALELNTQSYCGAFVARPSFVTTFPATMTAAQFVDKLNANAGNPLSQAERDQLVTDLSTNVKTRAQVIRAVVEDPDFVNAEFSRAFVLAEYFGYLRRNPNSSPDSDYSGYDFWLSKMNQFNGNYLGAQMTSAYLLSDEYRHRFGP